MKQRYRVTADIRYLDGPLSGQTIENGFSVGYPRWPVAERATRFLERVRTTKDFVRATGTGYRYEVLGRILLNEVSR